MPDTRADRVKAFKDEAELAGLKKESVAKMIDADVDSLEVVCLLQESTIEQIGLTMGQSLLLTKWVSELKAPPSPPVSDAGSTQLQHLLGEIAATDQDPVSQPGKPLFIPEFINRASVYTDDTSDNTICVDGDVRLIMKSSRPKLLPEQVSMAQWVGANARIMKRFVHNGALSTPEELCAYLEYVEMFSDYAQVNTLSSVMSYDHAFRRMQAEKNRPWDSEDFHLANFCLRKKDQPSHRGDFVSNSRGRNSNIDICRNYNADGCFRDSCRYAHVCSVCRVTGHPRSAHSASQPHSASSVCSASQPLNPHAARYFPSQRNT